MRKIVTSLFCMGLSLLMGWNPGFAQKPKSVVLNYKFSAGDKYRISVSAYKNFSVTSVRYAKTSYGDMSYDLELKIDKSDGDVYDATITAVLTRYTHNGVNLTYKLADIFKNYQWMLAFDRFGRVLDETVRYQRRTADEDSLTTGVLPGSMVFLIPFPDHSVKVNDKWFLKDFYEVNKIIGLLRPEWNISKPTVTGNYLLESIDGSTARIAADIEVSGNSELTDEKGAIQTEMLMRIDGRYDFDFTRGRLLSGSVTITSAAAGRTGNVEIMYDGTQAVSINFEKIK